MDQIEWHTRVVSTCNAIVSTVSALRLLASPSSESSILSPKGSFFNNPPDSSASHPRGSSGAAGGGAAGAAGTAATVRREISQIEELMCNVSGYLINDAFVVFKYRNSGISAPWYGWKDFFSVSLISL